MLQFFIVAFIIFIIAFQVNHFHSSVTNVPNRTSSGSSRFPSVENGKEVLMHLGQNQGLESRLKISNWGISTPEHLFWWTQSSQQSQNIERQEFLCGKNIAAVDWVKSFTGPAIYYFSLQYISILSIAGPVNDSTQSTAAMFLPQ